MKRWYMIAVRATQEYLVQKKLNSLGIETFYPLQKSPGYCYPVPLIPGYLYVKINPNSYQYVRVTQTGGVLDFIGFSAVPVEVSPDLIQYLQGNRWESSNPLRVGGTFKILQGKFRGFKGTLQEAQEGAAVITVDIFGREIDVDVSMGDLCMVS